MFCLIGCLLGFVKMSQPVSGRHRIIEPEPEPEQHLDTWAVPRLSTIGGRSDYSEEPGGLGLRQSRAHYPMPDTTWTDIHVTWQMFACKCRQMWSVIMRSINQDMHNYKCITFPCCMTFRPLNLDHHSISSVLWENVELRSFIET